MAYVLGFLRFWYDFIVGDDWRVAVGVALGLVATALANRVMHAWWLLPAVVMMVLAISVWPVRRAP